MNYHLIQYDWMISALNGVFLIQYGSLEDSSTIVKRSGVICVSLHRFYLTNTVLCFAGVFDMISCSDSFNSYPDYSSNMQLLTTHSHCIILMKGVMLW